MLANQKPAQEGFTLIELVVVIVILGILAATAIPKFIDLKTDASLAAAQGVAGALSSAFATNYAAYVVNTAKAVRFSGNVTLATAAATVLTSMPAGFTVTAATASVTCGASAGLALPFTVRATASGATQTAGATLICTG